MTCEKKTKTKERKIHKEDRFIERERSRRIKRKKKWVRRERERERNKEIRMHR